MIKFRVMRRLHVKTLSWDNLKIEFSKCSDVKLYNTLKSLEADKYITEYDDQVFGPCYKRASINSYRDYIRNLALSFLRFWYNTVMVLGSIAAILTLALTLLSIRE